MSCFLIFPNQLYEDLPEHLKQHKYTSIYIIEEPVYFYNQNKTIKPNKIKIAYMRACMKWYYSNILKTQNIQNLHYLEYKEVLKSKYSFLQNYSNISYFDTTDKDLDEKLKKLLLKNHKVNVFPTPNFIMNMEQLKEYHKQTPRHSTFYTFVKNKLKVLENVQNQDAYNRKPLPKNVKIPPHSIPFTSSTQSLKALYQEAIKYAKTNFASHPGDAEALYIYPITHEDSYKSVENFIKTKLNNFGPYQDAIIDDQPFLFHSVISAMLNIGLLNPKKILQIILKHYKNSKTKIPLNSLEGFIRQLIGWREYMRYLYIFHIPSSPTLSTPNLPKNKYFFKNPEPWYNGTTGILPLDKEIQKAVKYGYAHHIIRLMIFMNFFILCQIHPEQIYKWFMEVVAIDAYDWVMKSNIYSMGYFTKVGMNKPYISTSNYVLKMSNYKKDGHWDMLWTSLFYNFIKQKSQESQSYITFYKRLLYSQTKESLDNHVKRAKGFLESI